MKKTNSQRSTNSKNSGRSTYFSIGSHANLLVKGRKKPSNSSCTVPPTHKRLFSFTFFPRQLGFASSGQTYFTFAHDHFDLWLFDDFDQTEAESGALAPTELSSSAKTLLQILDGKECRLDSKDARIFHKKRNVPVVLIANQLPLPRSINILERCILMHFQQHIHELKESRVIATLWACINRRLKQHLD